MGKRVYLESAKKWYLENKKKTIGGSIGISTILLYFAFSFFTGALVLDGEITGGGVCEGTDYDVCTIYIPFCATEDVYWYPTDYDPYGRQTSLFEADPIIKDWKLYRSWGKGWREIPMTKTCTGTWCGGVNGQDVRYSVAWREGRCYNTSVVIWKYNATDKINLEILT